MIVRPSRHAPSSPLRDAKRGVEFKAIDWNTDSETTVIRGVRGRAVAVTYSSFTFGTIWKNMVFTQILEPRAMTSR